MTEQTSSTETPTSAFIRSARKYFREEYLPKIEHCLEKLTDEQVWWRPNAGSNSIGNLILHIAGNARQWIVSGLAGKPDTRVRQLEFDQSEVIPRADLVLQLSQTLAEVDRALREFCPERILSTYQIQGLEVTALDAIFHVTEHFSMHTGQIIMLTKIITEGALNFYNFSTGAPVQTWRKI